MEQVVPRPWGTQVWGDPGAATQLHGYSPVGCQYPNGRALLRAEITQTRPLAQDRYCTDASHPLREALSGATSLGAQGRGWSKPGHTCFARVSALCPGEWAAGPEHSFWGPRGHLCREVWALSSPGPVQSHRGPRLTLPQPSLRGPAPLASPSLRLAPHGWGGRGATAVPAAWPTQDTRRPCSRSRTSCQLLSSCLGHFQALEDFCHFSDTFYHIMAFSTPKHSRSRMGSDLQLSGFQRTPQTRVDCKAWVGASLGSWVRSVPASPARAPPPEPEAPPSACPALPARLRPPCSLSWALTVIEWQLHCRETRNLRKVDSANKMV